MFEDTIIDILEDWGSAHNHPQPPLPVTPDRRPHNRGQTENQNTAPNNDTDMAAVTLTPADLESGTGQAYLQGRGVANYMKSDSTPQRLSTLKHWVNFISVHPYIPPQSPPFFLGEGSSVNWPLVHDFLSFSIVAHEQNGNTLTKGAWDKLLNAVQDWTTRDLITRGFPVSKGLIRGNAEVKGITEKIKKRKAQDTDVNNSDLQVDLLRRVTAKQKLTFVEQCYCPTSSETTKLEALTRLQVAVGFTTLYCTAQRGEHARGLKYKFCCTRDLDHLGPIGTECDIVITNEGKTNANGHVRAQAIPPHR
jgi:hypothetical protein